MSEHEVELAARIAADARMKTQGCPRHGGFMESPHATCTCYSPEIVADLRARLADAEARAEAAVVLPDDEALAELLSWTTGDFTRWSPNAHPDHNRWSWRGEGHGESMRQHYRDAARRLREALRGDQ